MATCALTSNEKGSSGETADAGDLRSALSGVGNISLGRALVWSKD